MVTTLINRSIRLYAKYTKRNIQKVKNILDLNLIFIIRNIKNKIYNIYYPSNIN